MKSLSTNLSQSATTCETLSNHLSFFGDTICPHAQPLLFVDVHMPFWGGGRGLHQQQRTLVILSLFSIQYPIQCRNPSTEYTPQGEWFSICLKTSRKRHLILMQEDSFYSNNGIVRKVFPTWSWNPPHYNWYLLGPVLPPESLWVSDNGQHAPSLTTSFISETPHFFQFVLPLPGFSYSYLSDDIAWLIFRLSVFPFKYSTQNLKWLSFYYVQLASK